MSPLIRNYAVCINPTALRQAKIVCNFGLSKCNRVNFAIFVSGTLCVNNTFLRNSSTTSIPYSFLSGSVNLSRLCRAGY